jgi:hypothetical protein
MSNIKAAVLIAFVLGCCNAAAQSPTSSTSGLLSAGGKWTYEVSENKLTGALYGILTLKADESITDGVSSGSPSFVVMCGGTEKSPKWFNSKLLSPVVLGMPDARSPGDAPQQIVYLRADDKIKLHFWNMADDFRTFFVDKGATKDLVKSTNARIQFRDAHGHKQVAVFSPTGLNREATRKACGSLFD